MRRPSVSPASTPRRFGSADRQQARTESTDSVLAITVIEVALILSLMLAGGAQTATLPRDTLFATVMITFNGVVGVCVLTGGIRHREQSFQIAGVAPALGALVVLCGLPLLLGLTAKDQVLLVTFLVAAMTLGSGRTHVMQGAVHLVMFAAFLFLAVAP